MFLCADSDKVNSEVPVLNPFFSEEEKSPSEAAKPETDNEIVPNLLQFEPCVRSTPTTPTMGNNLSSIVLVNETQSRSESPESSAVSIQKKDNLHKSFDLRAILDSDSD